ncbi:FecR family protein [Maribellus luteus]|nr:FecR domain-containing protein [Maribellus luteus]
MNIDINTLINFSNGKYSYNDYTKIREWFEDIRHREDMAGHLSAQWDEITEQQKGADESLNHIFERIQYNILLEEKKQKKKISLWHFYRQVAAILLVPLLAFSAWYYSVNIRDGAREPLPEAVAQAWVSINAPEGARVEFMLPDSSRGWLNSGSKLRYPSQFGGQRQVELTGEAWFDVKHQNNSEFVVSVPDMDIKVLGTQFNVSAYTNDVFTDVSLEEGKIEINGKGAVFNQVLAPNEKILFNRNSRTVSLSEVDASRYSAWKDGYLVIDNEPLGQVVSRLERWYNVDIEIQDEVLKSYRFKATFKDELLEEVLKLMAKTTPIRYTIEQRSADAGGVFKQKKVTMRLKR